MFSNYCWSFEPAINICLALRGLPESFFRKIFHKVVAIGHNKSYMSYNLWSQIHLGAIHKGRTGKISILFAKTQIMLI